MFEATMSSINQGISNDCFSLHVVDDTLESVLGGSDDEAEEDAVMSQVLDEIGIDVTNKVRLLIRRGVHSCPISLRCVHSCLIRLRGVHSCLMSSGVFTLAPLGSGVFILVSLGLGVFTLASLVSGVFTLASLGLGVFTLASLDSWVFTLASLCSGVFTLASLGSGMFTLSSLGSGVGVSSLWSRSITSTCTYLVVALATHLVGHLLQYVSYVLLMGWSRLRLNHEIAQVARSVLLWTSWGHWNTHPLGVCSWLVMNQFRSLL